MEDADIGMADATKPSGLRRRLDPRSGKYVLMQPESFWRDHEARRKADGASIPDYCEANGLARATFQRWVSAARGSRHAQGEVCRSVRKPASLQAKARSSRRRVFCRCPPVRRRRPRYKRHRAARRSRSMRAMARRCGCTMKPRAAASMALVLSRLGGKSMILSSAIRAWICVEPIDMRKSIDGIAALVGPMLGQDPFSGQVFVFIGRRRNKVKCLLWDRTGFWCLYKRFERARLPDPRRRWPARWTRDGGAECVA